mgnify:CR=1 FL=1
MGLFQFALPAAALTDQRPHGCGKVPAKEGVQPLAHAPHTVGTLGDRSRINVVVALLSAFYPAFFFQPVQKIEHRGRGQPYCGVFRQYPAGWRVPAGHTASMTCSSAADSGRSRSGSPYICAAPPFRVFLLHLSLLFHYTGFCRKRQEAEIPMKSGYFSLFLQLSLFFVFARRTFVCFVPAQGFSGSIFVQRCSCFRARKIGILRLRK